MIIKFIYTIFIGVLFATFVGVGIAAFYPQEKAPEYPIQLRMPKEDPNGNEEQNEQSFQQQIEYEKQMKEYQNRAESYNRNVSIIALVAAIITVIVSLTLFRKILVIADGLLLGGVLTLIYSIIRGFTADSEMFRFIVVSIGLAVSLTLGYIKFIKTSKTS